MFRALLTTLLGLVAVLSLGAGAKGQPEEDVVPTRVVGAAPALSTLLGVVDGRLVRIDPKTLAALPGKRVTVGSGGCAPRQGGTACWTVPPWTASRDGQFLVVAQNVPARKLRFVQNPMYVTWDLPLDSGQIGALAWIARRRMLALEEGSGETQRLLAIDLNTQRIATRRPLRGSVMQLARTPKELVLLLAPPRSIGPARVAVADGHGRVRFARVGQILVGSKLLGAGSNYRVDARSPGFAVDPQGHRAFVVGQQLAAEVDLRSLAVSYHTLGRRPSLLARLWNWLEPAAAAKRVSGYDRRAQWLGADLIALSGTDSAGNGGYQPAGLATIDTRDWSVSVIDRGATSFAVAGDLLLATGAEMGTTPIGLVAYGYDGTRRFQLLEGEHAWLAQIYDGRAYVGIAGGAQPLRIVDLPTGQIVGTRQEPLPWLLLGAASGWWEG
jgi:hypothetical protein